MSRVDTLYPYDGPHTPETVRAAAEDVSALVRYLARATRDGDSVRQLPDLAQIVGYLSGAIGDLPQVFMHLSEHARRISMWSDVYDDRGGDPAVVARDLDQHLRTAGHSATVAAGILSAAHEAASRLGTNEGDPT